MKFVYACCTLLFLASIVSSADDGVSVAIDDEIDKLFQNVPSSAVTSELSKKTSEDAVADKEMDELFQNDAPATEISETTTEATGGIVKFFNSFKDSVKNAGNQLKDGFKELKENVSARFASTTTSTPTTTSDDSASSTLTTTTSSPAIVFPTEEGVTHENGTIEGGLDDRFLIDAPTKCEAGYRLAGSTCRRIA